MKLFLYGGCKIIGWIASAVNRRRYEFESRQPPKFKLKETSVRQLHTKTEAEEVTVGNHKSIIKEWEVKTLLVELYGIVECKLLGF